MTGRPLTTRIPSPAGGVQMETFIPWALVKRGARRKVIPPLDAPDAFRAEAQTARKEKEAAKDTPLLRALGLAHYWQRLLDEGKFRSLSEIAATEGLDRGQASRIARLTQLAPCIVEACLADKDAGLRLEPLIRPGVPAGWGDQLGGFI